MLLKRIGSNFREISFYALKFIRPVYLEGNKSAHIIFPDAFGCFEEIFFKQIYFKPKEIFSADVIIDLGAH